MKLPSDILIDHLDSDQLFARLVRMDVWHHDRARFQTVGRKRGESEAFNDCHADIEEAQNALIKRALDAEDKVNDLEKEIEELKKSIKDRDDRIEDLEVSLDRYQ